MCAALKANIGTVEMCADRWSSMHGIGHQLETSLAELKNVQRQLHFYHETLIALGQRAEATVRLVSITSISCSDELIQEYTVVGDKLSTCVASATPGSGTSTGTTR